MKEKQRKRRRIKEQGIGARVVALRTNTGEFKRETSSLFRIFIQL
jgi:hypothetical protein